MGDALVWLGFLLGVRHAVEPDHLAAVTSLTQGDVSPRYAVRLAAAWGAGHAAVLGIAGSAMVMLGVVFTPGVARALEVVVGATLVWLGVDALSRTRRGSASPVGARPRRPVAVGRALFIGGLHGLEGSGAVVLMALPALHGTPRAVLYLALFGGGSILGMLVSSLVVSIPASFTARRFAWGRRAIELAVGTVAVAVGSNLTAHGIFVG
jgi:hypothetical protein